MRVIPARKGTSRGEGGRIRKKTKTKKAKYGCVGGSNYIRPRGTPAPLQERRKRNGRTILTMGTALGKNRPRYYESTNPREGAKEDKTRATAGTK